MSDDDDSDDDSSGSASSDSTSEEDIQPPEDVRNTVCMLQNNIITILQVWHLVVI